MEAHIPPAKKVLKIPSSILSQNQQNREIDRYGEKARPVFCCCVFYSKGTGRKREITKFCEHPI